LQKLVGIYDLEKKDIPIKQPTDFFWFSEGACPEREGRLVASANRVPGSLLISANA